MQCRPSFRDLGQGNREVAIARITSRWLEVMQEMHEAAICLASKRSDDTGRCLLARLCNPAA